MVRAKFHLYSITEYSYGRAKRLNFQATYDPNIPEDQKFAKSTPSGNLEMTVDNPAALAQFENGKSYYLDFTLAE